MNNEQIKKAMAEKIKQVIKAYGLKNKDFARLMDVPPSTVTKWLSGTHNFTTNTMFEIERALNIKLFNLNP